MLLSSLYQTVNNTNFTHFIEKFIKNNNFVMNDGKQIYERQQTGLESKF